MRRETSNRIRFVIEDLLPPFVRDGWLFRVLARGVFGKAVDVAADFRRRAPFLSEEEYNGFYRDWTGPHEETDNSRACLERIARDVVGGSVCDAGCGTGYLLRYLRDQMPDETIRLAGTEIRSNQHIEGRDIEFFDAKIERLPFRDGEFDTVVCTHVIEHVLDYRTAISELRRIAAKRLIIVLPMEREALFGFNLHVNFFPYPHSFLRAMMPVPKSYICTAIGRDIYYREDRGA